jgi:hypothetical protein
MGGVDEHLTAKSEETVVSCLENMLWDMLESGKLSELLHQVSEAVKNGEG